MNAAGLNRLGLELGGQLLPALEIARGKPPDLRFILRGGGIGHRPDREARGGGGADGIEGILKDDRFPPAPL